MVRFDWTFWLLPKNCHLQLAAPSIGLVIEAKHPRKNLDKHVYQLRSYLTSLDISYGLLTNGKELRIYHQTAGAVRLVLQCATQDLEERLADIIPLIGRDFIHKQCAQTPAPSPPQPVALPISASSPISSYENYCHLPQ